MWRFFTQLALALGLVAQAQAQTFNNPVVYADYPDNDVFLGPDGKTFYFSASNFHYSPGAPILKSTDLVNWEPVGHSIPTLDFGEGYSMQNGKTNYNGGTWASTMRYRASNQKWYWYGCVNFWTTYVYTASDVSGPWTQSSNFQPCFYDCGLLIDDDDTMYVVYGNTNVSVAQLSSDGLSVVKTQVVFSFPSECTGIEGNRMYKINGLYYILDDCPADGRTEIWKASSPWGPYTRKTLVNNIPGPVPGSGTPVQGSLVETPNGDWYFMSFSWAYPLGRLPVLAPITWGSDGFPILQTDSSGGWGTSYTYPLPKNDDTQSWIGGEQFWGSSLGPKWEWNHNPDWSKVSFNNPGLTLSTATVTDDLFHARNTLIHRLHGKFPVGTVQIDFTNMADGDSFGLAAFKEQSAWIGVIREGSTYTIQTVQGATQDPNNNWATSNKGTVVASAAIDQRRVWLQVSMDARADGNKQAQFSYSLDGNNFVTLGGTYTLSDAWNYFMGYRYGIFNFAKKALGGSIKVVGFVSWTN